jgi:hypothetical protein
MSYYNIKYIKRKGLTVRRRDGEEKSKYEEEENAFIPPHHKHFHPSLPSFSFRLTKNSFYHAPTNLSPSCPSILTALYSLFL